MESRQETKETQNTKMNKIREIKKAAVDSRRVSPFPKVGRDSGSG